MRAGFCAIESPLSGTQWQSYYMDDLIAFLEIKEPGNYNTQAIKYKDPTFHKITYPERKGFFNTYGDIESPKTIRNDGMLDMSEVQYEEYNIYIVSGKDGIGLRKYFNLCVARPGDLVFFLEDNTDDISDPVLLCKMGIKWRKRFEVKQVKSNNILKNINSALQIDITKFNELISKGEIKGYPWIDTADTVGKTIYSTAYFINYIACISIVKIMEVLIEGLELLKIKETGWLPDADKTNEFTPALIPTGSKKEIGITKEVIKTLIEGCIDGLNKLDVFIDEMLKSDSIIGAFMQKLIGGFLAKAKTFIKSIVSGLAELEEILMKLIDVGVNMLNAFLCGIINGFVDAVIGIATLIKWLFDVGVSMGDILSDIKNKLPNVLEALDNLILAWSVFSFADFFGALKNNLVKFIKAVFSELEAGIDTQMLYRIAYFAGNVVGFVIEFIIELLLTGGAAAATKFFTMFAGLGEKIVAKLTSLLEKLLSISLKEIGKDIVSGLTLIATFFKIKGEKLAEFFAKFFEELKVIFGIGFKPATEALFEKLGLTWTSIRIPTLNAGVRLGDQLWGVYHKGVLVVKGTKKEIEEFAEKLKGMSDDVAKKYLNDLFEAKRFIKSVYGESELSKLAIEFRKGLKIPKHNGNVVVFEYINNVGNITRKEFTTLSKEEFKALGLEASPHAEIIGLEWLEKNKIPFDDVKTIYSELEPCSLEISKCKERLIKKCKNAILEFSFEYPGTNVLNAEIRRASVELRMRTLKKLFF